MALLKNTPPIRSVDPNTYDAICLAGGHGAMFDFTHNSELHNLIASVYERGAIVASHPWGTGTAESSMYA